VFSLALMRRARAKLIKPVYEIGAVLDACRAGDVHRRFNPGDASLEFQEIAEVINQLVTEHFSTHERSWDPQAKLDRLALLRLLDARAEPIVVCDPGGAIAAANEAALEVLGGPEGGELREELTRAGRGEPADSITVEPLGREGFVCRYRSGSDAGSSLGSIAAPSFGGSASLAPDPVDESSGSA
jgi:PAS domain-containing protein